MWGMGHLRKGSTGHLVKTATGHLAKCPDAPVLTCDECTTIPPTLADCTPTCTPICWVAQISGIAPNNTCQHCPITNFPARSIKWVDAPGGNYVQCWSNSFGAWNNSNVRIDIEIYEDYGCSIPLPFSFTTVEIRTIVGSGTIRCIIFGGCGNQVRVWFDSGEVASTDPCGEIHELANAGYQGGFGDFGSSPNLGSGGIVKLTPRCT